ncbi:CueP family metal-binding protein [Amphibacillus sediminis]|uniref:CueP family metal-binding protein n=1 Tax=Amphibacillus sediminis TaxID=360185 RepID=UPI0008356A57|nr:CueP family metal-binding protein [Amphibacillus sediminis]
MKKIISIFTIIVAVILTVVIINRNQTTEFTSAEIEELVHNYSIGNHNDISASITSEQLIVTKQNNEEITYDLPDDQFFISIAPYQDETHPCVNHSLTGCQGEMVNEEFDLLIEDADGNVIIDQTVTSLSNGFIDLWLPRNQTYQVIISQNGKSAKSELSSFRDDPTCITTMQLK